MSHQNLFILGMNDSGTTFLQNTLSECVNCVSFQGKKRPNGMEGQGVSFWKKKQKGWYPRDLDQGITKLFSEKKEVWENPKNFNWKEIKGSWNEAWKQNPHWNKADPKILLEKTPSAIFSVDIYRKQFPQGKFIIIHRNPYAICEGIQRTVKKYKKVTYDLERCAKHWVECSIKQIQNIDLLCKDGSAIWFKYEDMVTKPELIAKQIKDFMPALHDISFRKNVMCHSMDPAQKRPIVNYNNRHLKNLASDQFKKINQTLEKCPDIMKFYGYEYRNEAP